MHTTYNLYDLCVEIGSNRESIGLGFDFLKRLALMAVFSLGGLEEAAVFPICRFLFFFIAVQSKGLEFKSAQLANIFLWANYVFY